MILVIEFIYIFFKFPFFITVQRGKRSAAELDDMREMVWYFLLIFGTKACKYILVVTNKNRKLNVSMSPLTYTQCTMCPYK